LLQFLDDLWHNCEQVPDYSNISYLEYWSIRILIGAD
jgi:hypothetical protein